MANEVKGQSTISPGQIAQEVDFSTVSLADFSTSSIIGPERLNIQSSAILDLASGKVLQDLMRTPNPQDSLAKAGQIGSIAFRQAA